MPIEFNCQSCGRLMRTPDSAAGKKGKCPQCGAMMAIPLTSAPQTSVPTGSSHGSEAGATREQAQGQAADDKIEFPCPKCSLPVRTPASVAGKKGKCPNCGEVVQIPARTLEAPATKDNPAAKIQFRCPGCQKMLRTPADVAGKKIKCPSCSAVLSVPTTGKQKGHGDAQPSTTPVLDKSIGLAPLGDATSLAPADHAPSLAPLEGVPSLAPLEDVPSLTPVDERPSLTPLDDVPSLTPVDESPGLTPVDDIPALTPFETGPTLTPLEGVPSLEPLGASTGLTPLETQPSLTPLADDPLANAAAYQTSAAPMSPSADGLAPNPFGDNLGPASAPGAMAGNPYQSPALAQTGYGAKQPRPFNETIVVAPAIAMMVVAGLNCLVTIPYLIFNMVEALAMGKAMQGEDEAFIAGYVFGSVVVSVILCVVVLAVYVLTFIGAWKMKKMEGYGLAITASILMMLPCTFCWSGLPFGIWALVVLCLQDVRQAFR